MARKSSEERIADLKAKEELLVEIKNEEIDNPNIDISSEIPDEGIEIHFEPIEEETNISSNYNNEVIVGSSEITIPVGNLKDEEKEALKEKIEELLIESSFSKKEETTTIVKTKKELRKEAKQIKKQEHLKEKKRKKEYRIQNSAYSKRITTSTVVLAYIFIIFICLEMHLTGNLEPVAYVGAGLVLMLGICVRAYMKRAYQQDLVNMKINQTEKLSELKKEYGDDFFYDSIADVNLDGRE